MFILWLLKNEGERDRASKVIFLSFYENVVKAMNLFPRKTQICIFWHVSFFKKCTLLERTPQAFYLKGLCWDHRLQTPHRGDGRRRAECAGRSAGKSQEAGGEADQSRIYADRLLRCNSDPVVPGGNATRMLLPEFPASQEKTQVWISVSNVSMPKF